MLWAWKIMYSWENKGIRGGGEGDCTDFSMKGFMV